MKGRIEMEFKSLIVGQEQIYPERSKVKTGDIVTLVFEENTDEKKPMVVVKNANGDDIGYLASSSYSAEGYTKASEVIKNIKSGFKAKIEIIDNKYVVVITDEAAAKVYYVIGTGSKAMYPARFLSAKFLRDGQTVNVTYKGGSFYDNGQLCAGPASESSNEYKDALKEAKKEGYTLLSKEALSTVLEGVDDSNIKGTLMKMNINSTYLIRVTVTTSEELPELESDFQEKLDNILESISENRAEGIKTRIQWLKKEAGTLSEEMLHRFAMRLAKHEGEIKPFAPKFRNYNRILDRCVEAVDCGFNLRFVGPPGCGKNVLAEDLVNLFDVKLSDMPLSISTDLDQLLGTTQIVPSIKKEISEEEVVSALKSIKGGEEDTGALKKLIDVMTPVSPETEFVPSVMIDNIEKGATCTILDEANMAMANILSVLHSATDGRRYINVPGYHQVQLHDESFFIVTMNAELEGTRPLNAAFKDRFSTIRFERSKSIADILKVNVPKIKAKDLKALEALYDKIQKSIGPALSEDSFSIRAFVRAAQKIVAGVSVKNAILDTIVEEIDDDADRQSVAELVNLMMK